MSYLITASPSRSNRSKVIEQQAPNLKMLDKWLDLFERNGWIVHKWEEK